MDKDEIKKTTSNNVENQELSEEALEKVNGGFGGDGLPSGQGRVILTEEEARRLDELLEGH